MRDIIYIIIFSIAVLINHCGSNCCCKCCNYSATQENDNEINQKEYFVPPRYFNKSTLDERPGTKNPIEPYKLKIDYTKFIDFTNLDERPITSPELFLDSGIHYRTPLNMIWANNNCAVLSVVRLLISEPHFMNVLLNKGKVDIKEIRDPKRRKRIEEKLKKIAKDVELEGIRDNVSKVIRGVLNGERKDYNNFFNWVSEILGVDRTECDIVFASFINIYFENDFKSYISPRIYVNDPILSTLDFVDYKFSKNLDEISTGDYLYVCCRNLKDDRMVLCEEIEIKQSPSCEIYKYELIGAIFVCGELENVEDTCSSDYACMVPVYDSNRNKLGYVMYQFDDVSKVKSLDYWNNVDNLKGWENPRPTIAIYRIKEKDIKLKILKK